MKIQVGKKYKDGNVIYKLVGITMKYLSKTKDPFLYIIQNNEYITFAVDSLYFEKNFKEVE